MRRSRDDDVVPDNPDEALLGRLGTRQRYRETFATAATRTVKPNVDATAVGALLDRASGVRIHAMALAHGTASARFREMWRVFESRVPAEGKRADRAARRVRPQPARWSSTATS